MFSFGAELYVEGHSETVIPPAELEALPDKVRVAELFVRGATGAPAELAVLSKIREETGQEPDEDMASFVRAFIAGNPRRD